MTRSRLYIPDRNILEEDVTDSILVSLLKRYNRWFPSNCLRVNETENTPLFLAKSGIPVNNLVFPFFLTDLSRSLPTFSLFPHASPARIVGSIGGETRSSNKQSTGQIPPPLPNPSVQPILCGRKEERIAQAHQVRYVKQERNYYRRVTYSDVLPFVESSHILQQRSQTRLEQWLGLRSDSHIMQIPTFSLFRHFFLVPPHLFADSLSIIG